MTYKWIRKFFLVAICFLNLCYFFACKSQNKLDIQSENLGNDIQDEVQVESIEVALLNAEKEYEDYIPVKNFNPKKSGHYEAVNDAKTAYIGVRVKAEKPANGDYSVEVNNATTYLNSFNFSRLTDENASYLECKDVVLSKGRNVLEIKVKNTDGTNEGIYTALVNYDGGPDPLKLEMEEREMLPGVYCPAQRKPLEGEKPDFVWMIGIAGY